MPSEPQSVSVRSRRQQPMQIARQGPIPNLDPPAAPPITPAMPPPESERRFTGLLIPPPMEVGPLPARAGPGVSSQGGGAIKKRRDCKVSFSILAFEFANEVVLRKGFGCSKLVCATHIFASSESKSVAAVATCCAAVKAMEMRMPIGHMDENGPKRLTKLEMLEMLDMLDMLDMLEKAGWPMEMRSFWPGERLSFFPPPALSAVSFTVALQQREHTDSFYRRAIFRGPGRELAALLAGSVSCAYLLDCLDTRDFACVILTCRESHLVGLNLLIRSRRMIA